MESHSSVFTRVYENAEWGSNAHAGYAGSSGQGSSVQFNANTYVPFLKRWLTENGCKSVVDLGCGDFRCGPLIYDDLPITYTGYDAYEKVVLHNQSLLPADKYTFVHLNFAAHLSELVAADVCILKDVIQHWKVEDIYACLDYLSTCGKFKWILICNCSYQAFDDEDITQTGHFRALSANFLPLKKYGARIVYRYNTKEVSIICGDVSINSI